MIPRPNPEAVQYLEADLDRDASFNRQLRTAENADGLRFWTTIGASETHGGAWVPRPMFEVVHDLPGKKGAARVWNPCPACHDFSRSWNCPDHDHALQEA